MSSLLKQALPRLFVAPERLVLDRPLLLDGAEHHYLTRVLRLSRGNRLLLLDGCGRVADAQVTAIDGEQLTLIPHLIEHTDRGPASRAARLPALYLFVGLIKGERHDLVIQKATELGAQRIYSIVCARSVPDLDGPRAEKRQQRWLRVAQAAAQQCRRPDVPLISPPLPFADTIVHSGSGPRLIFCESSAPPLRTLLSPQPSESSPPPVSLLIGPEGGLTPAEVSVAAAAGYLPCSLGPHILRAETAALAALAAVTALLDGSPMSFDGLQQ